MKYYIKSHIKFITKCIMILWATTNVLLWQACKEPTYTIENEESYSRVFMQLASNGVIETSFPIKDEWTSISFGAGYGGLLPLTQNVQIDFEIAQNQVDVYNQQNNTNYELPPSESYKLNNLSVEIPAGGSGSNSIDLEVNSLELKGTKAYLLPISIRNVTPGIPIAEGLETTYFIVKGFYETNPYTAIPKTEWEIVEVSSENADGIGGLGRHCIDGDVNTCWLSQYSRFPDGTRPVHPHHVVVDMKNTETLHGIQLFGRRTVPPQSSQTYLFPKNVHIEVSNDGSTWESAGVFSIIAAVADDPEATMYFEQALQGRYIKVTVLNSTSANGDTTAIAELVAF